MLGGETFGIDGVVLSKNRLDVGRLLNGFRTCKEYSHTRPTYRNVVFVSALAMGASRFEFNIRRPMPQCPNYQATMNEEQFYQTECDGCLTTHCIPPGPMNTDKQAAQKKRSFCH